MAVLRTDIERAPDELASQEEGMRFQGLAVVLGKKRWPELIARQRKKDLGLDAYAPSGLTPGENRQGTRRFDHANAEEDFVLTRRPPRRTFLT